MPDERTFTQAEVVGLLKEVADRNTELEAQVKTLAAEAKAAEGAQAKVQYLEAGLEEMRAEQALSLIHI